MTRMLTSIPTVVVPTVTISISSVERSHGVFVESESDHEIEFADLESNWALSIGNACHGEVLTTVSHKKVAKIVRKGSTGKQYILRSTRAGPWSLAHYRQADPRIRGCIHNYDLDRPDRQATSQ